MVVYACHGIGRVEARRAASGDLQETIVVACDSGMRVTLPVAVACRSLRPVSGAHELEDVRRALAAEPSRAVGSWAQRFRATREKVTAGRAAGLAEVVRDGVHRDRRVAGGSGNPAAPSERQLYLQARMLLTAEVAAAQGVDASAADGWIVAQVSDDLDPGIGRLAPPSRAGRAGSSGSG